MLDLQNEVKCAEGFIAELVVVADGCLTHPSYRAVREPSADCERCRAMFELRQSLLRNAVLLPRTEYEGRVLELRKERARQALQASLVTPANADGTA